jgi:hypothetical protein
MDGPDMWGGVYGVRLEGAEGERELVARHLRIPPLRQGLEERMEGLTAAVDEWRTHPQSTRVAVIDVLRDGDSIWLIAERADGMDIATLVKKRGTSRKATWRAAVASSLADMLGGLLDLPIARHLLGGLSPRHIVVTPRGGVCLVNLGLKRFLTPGPRPVATPDELQSLALRRFGEIMYTLLTGDEFQYGDVIVEDALPEDMGYMVLRALSPHRSDAWPGLSALRAELALYRRMVDAERIVAASWDDVDLEPIPTLSFGQRFLPPPLYRLSEKVMAGAEAHPRLMRGLRWGAVAAFAIAWGVVFATTHLVGLPFSKPAGPVIYVAEAGGIVQVIDSDVMAAVGRVDLGEEIGGALYSRKFERAYFSLPSSRSVASLDLAAGRVERGAFATVAPIGLYRVPGEALGLGTSGTDELATIDLARDRALRSVRLPGRPLTLLYLSVVNAIAYVPQSADRVLLYSPITRKVLASYLGRPPLRALALDPDGRGVWVRSGDVSNRIDVLGTRDLHLMSSVELPAAPLDIAFGREAYVLLADGRVAVVRLSDRKSDRVLSFDHPPAKRIMFEPPNTLWFIGDDPVLTAVRLGEAGNRQIPLAARPTAVVEGF